MAELVVVKGEHRGGFVKILTTSVTIGRGSKVDLSLQDDSKASHKHARVTPMGGDRYLLEDLGSTNGTFVNEERIEQVPLRSGDLIQIGRALIVFRSDDSSVRLEDIALVGGGSSGAIARKEVGSSSFNVANSSSAALRKIQEEEGSPAENSERDALQNLILATGEVGLGRGIERTLKTLRKACGAGRAMLFLRHPVTGGLGCAASQNDPKKIATGSPVEADLLSRAISGEVVATDDAAAAPLRILGIPAGAIYMDGCGGDAKLLSVLTAAGLILGTMVGLNRSRRLAASATEIVGLAQVSVQKRPFDVGTHIGATDRLYAGVARARGLEWSVDTPEGSLASADPVLFGRGLDKLVEHTLAEAKGEISISIAPPTPGYVTILLRYGTSESHDAVAASDLVDPQGIAADLRRAAESFGDGILAAARVALMRSGVRFSVKAENQHVVFSLRMEAAAPGSAL